MRTFAAGFSALEAQAVRPRQLLVDGADHRLVGGTPAETRLASLQALQATGIPRSGIGGSRRTLNGHTIRACIAQPTI